MGSSGKARNSSELVVQRLRTILAIVAIVCATALMWSDSAIRWWSEIVSFFLRANYDATTSVMNNRPTGDADLHAVIWGACALLIVIACTTHQNRVRAVLVLAIWSLFVEIAQPWFTDLRSRQASDLIGNFIGAGTVVVVLQLTHMRKSVTK